MCDGILPIDQLKSDYISPIRHLVGLLPPEAFEEAYAIKLRNDEERADGKAAHLGYAAKEALGQPLGVSGSRTFSKPAPFEADEGS